jgi:predicted DsbA family dithiol-disulfide isomerase
VAPELFAGFDPAQFPSTSLPAMALAAAAYRQDVHLGELVSLALRDALFEHSLDISDSAVLADIGRTHGVHREPGDDARVVDQWHEGQARGVVGSPHFFVNGEESFCPSMEITRIDGKLHIESDPDALERFLQSALG